MNTSFESETSPEVEINESVEERVLNIDEKIAFYNNPNTNDSEAIAKKALEQEDATERIAQLRSELGVAPKESSFSVSEEGILEEIKIEDKEISSEMQEEILLEESLDTLEQEIKSLTAEQKEEIVSNPSRSIEQLWQFKEKKLKPPFLKFLIELMDGKGVTLKKMLQFVDYVSSKKKEIHAELVYRKEHTHE